MFNGEQALIYESSKDRGLAGMTRKLFLTFTRFSCLAYEQAPSSIEHIEHSPCCSLEGNDDKVLLGCI